MFIVENTICAQKPQSKISHRPNLRDELNSQDGGDNICIQNYQLINYFFLRKIIIFTYNNDIDIQNTEDIISLLYG